MANAAQYFSQFQTARGGFNTLPPFCRTIVAIFALPGIALLHAYSNPAHEILLRDALNNAFHKLGKPCDVVCSHEVLPEIREYERTATTVAEAYARPVVQKYLETLSSRLAAAS